MRLYQLFETTEEDRAIVSAASLLTKSIIDFADIETSIDLGKIGDMVDTPLHAINDIVIKVLPLSEFSKLEIFDDGKSAPEDSFGFYDGDSNEIILNAHRFRNKRFKTVLVHELRHALDQMKSDKWALSGDNHSYFTPKGKISKDASDHERYLAEPVEINARFLEVLSGLTKNIPARYKLLTAGTIRKQLTHDVNTLFKNYEIAQCFPEGTKSRSYKRLYKRAMDYIQKESAHVESELAKAGTPKIATGNW